jgi:hypothetical protein
MRKLTVILFLLFSMSCKKNKDHVPSGFGISKEYMNNILISERTYGSDGKLAREQSYDEQTG